MSGFSLTLRQAIGAHVFRNTRMPPPPAVLWVAAFNVMPDVRGEGGGEVSSAGTGYTRLAVPTGGAGTGIGAQWTEPDELAKIRNALELKWPKATGNYGRIAGFALFDAPTGGMCWGLGELLEEGESLTILRNDQLVIDPGQLEFTVA